MLKQTEYCSSCGKALSTFNTVHLMQILPHAGEQKKKKRGGGEAGGFHFSCFIPRRMHVGSEGVKKTECRCVLVSSCMKNASL